MVKILVTSFFLFLSYMAYGQSVNEKLFQAVTIGDSINVESLLHKGGNSNFKKKLGGFEMSMLIWAVQKQQIKIVKLLLAYKAEVNYKDWFKTTALMYAASEGNLEIVKLLIDNQADPNAKDDQGNTVLSAAEEGNNPEVIKLIQGLQKK